MLKIYNNFDANSFNSFTSIYSLRILYCAYYSIRNSILVLRMAIHMPVSSCCNSCNNDDKIEERKTVENTILCSSTMCSHPVTPQTRGSVDYPATRGIQVDVGLPDATSENRAESPLYGELYPNTIPAYPVPNSPIYAIYIQYGHLGP